jgi:hypothetical protein
MRGAAAPCTCFSLCTQSQAELFLRHLPTLVENASSPWFGYLTAVYRRRPALPFNLSALNFFYHRHQRWPAEVEWPMSTCDSHSDDGGGAWAGHVSGGNASARRGRGCPSSLCARWLPTLRTRTARKAAPHNATWTHLGLQILRERDGSSHGTVLFEALTEVRGTKLPWLSGSERWRTISKLEPGRRPLLGREVTPSGGWAEVRICGALALRNDGSLLR